MFLQCSTLSHRLPDYLSQLVVDSHSENFLHKHLNCLLLEEVVDTCQDSQSCQEDLQCCLSECPGAGYHLLLEAVFQSCCNKCETVALEIGFCTK